MAPSGINEASILTRAAWISLVQWRLKDEKIKSRDSSLKGQISSSRHMG